MDHMLRWVAIGPIIPSYCTPKDHHEQGKGSPGRLGFLSGEFSVSVAF